MKTWIFIFEPKTFIYTNCELGQTSKIKFISIFWECENLMNRGRSSRWITYLFLFFNFFFFFFNFIYCLLFLLYLFLLFNLLFLFHHYNRLPRGRNSRWSHPLSPTSFSITCDPQNNFVIDFSLFAFGVSTSILFPTPVIHIFLFTPLLLLIIVRLEISISLSFHCS